MGNVFTSPRNALLSLVRFVYRLRLQVSSGTSLAETAVPLDTLGETIEAYRRRVVRSQYQAYAGLESSSAGRPSTTPAFFSSSTVAALERAMPTDDAAKAYWRFCCRGHVDAVTLPALEQAEGLRRSMQLDEQTGRVDLVSDQLVFAYASVIDLARAAAKQLGVHDLAEFYGSVMGVDLDRLVDESYELLEATDAAYDALVMPLARVIAAGRPVTVSDLVSVVREGAGHLDPKLLLPTLDETLSDLGIHLSAQPGLQFDLVPRPNKIPGAFCAPIEVPSHIVVSVRPRGTLDDLRALFHETGHAEHFVHIDPSLPNHLKHFGDPTASEGWAMVFELLVGDPDWVESHLPLEPVAAQRSTLIRLLIIARRACARLRYELEIARSSSLDLVKAEQRYVELFKRALRATPRRGDYLRDLTTGFETVTYLRSWAFEAIVRDDLTRRYGQHWFRCLQAGDLLRACWRQGQPLQAELLLLELASVGLSLEALAKRFEHETKEAFR